MTEIEILRAETKRLWAAIEEIQDEWQSAVSADFSSEAAARMFAKDYPTISSFGTVLARIFDEEDTND